MKIATSEWYVRLQDIADKISTLEGGFGEKRKNTIFCHPRYSDYYSKISHKSRLGTHIQEKPPMPAVANGCVNHNSVV